MSSILVLLPGSTHLFHVEMFKNDILDNHKLYHFSYIIDEVQVTHHAKGCQREDSDFVQLLLFKVTQQGQCLTFRKKSWGKLAPKFSFLVARTSILVAKNYI